MVGRVLLVGKSAMAASTNTDPWSRMLLIVPERLVQERLPFGLPGKLVKSHVNPSCR
jgi:hypothetical protein